MPYTCSTVSCCISAPFSELYGCIALVTRGRSTVGRWPASSLFLSYVVYVRA